MGISFLTNNVDKDVMVFYQTRDGGLHWKRAGSPPTEVWGRTKGYSFLDDGTGWMVVEDKIFQTDDFAAKTWRKLPATVPIWFVKHLESDDFQLRFDDHKTGWLFVPWFKNKLLRTIDGGESWKRLF